jgi:plastocyanin
MDRRRYIRTVAAAGTAAAFAGCMDDPGNGNGDMNTDDDTPTPTATDDETTADDETTSEDETTGEDDASATEEPDEATATPPPDPDQRVAVGDGLSFDPAAFEISVGDTVLWEWTGNGHNVKYDDGEVPSGTDWEGTEGGRTETYGEGHVHFHTFETAGEYSYYCVPHQSSGMTGRFTVTE